MLPPKIEYLKNVWDFAIPSSIDPVVYYWTVFAHLPFMKIKGFEILYHSWSKNIIFSKDIVGIKISVDLKNYIVQL